MTHTSFARRLMLGILLGLAALVGLCYLAGFIRYQRRPHPCALSGLC